MEQSTFLWAEPPARTSASPDSGRESMESVVRSRLSLLDWLAGFGPAGWFGRTYPACCRLTEDGRLESSSGCWGNSGMGSPTEFLTLDVSALGPRDPEYSWSEILEDGSLPQRCYLTEKALLGIKRGIEKKRKRRAPRLFSLREAEWLTMTDRITFWTSSAFAHLHRSNGSEL